MNLPDLTAKVKVSTEGITEAEMRLKELGESTRGSVEHIKEYLRLTEGGARPGGDTFERARLNAALAAQATGDLKEKLEKVTDAFVTFGAQGEIAGVRIASSTAKTREEIEALEVRARSFAEGIGKDMAGAGTAVIRLGEDGEDSLRKMTASLENTGDAFVKFGSQGEIAGMRIASSTAKTREEIDALERRARTFAESMGKDMGAAGSAMVRLAEDGTASLVKTTASLENTTEKVKNTTEAVVRFGREGEISAIRISSATGRSAEDFKTLERRARTFGENVAQDLKGVTSAAIKLAEDGTASLEKVSTGLQSTQDAASHAHNLFRQLGSTWALLGAWAIPSLVIAIVALIAATLPLIIVIAAATTILAAFTAGLIATIAVLGLAFLALGGMAAGVVFLADRLFTTGKMLQDPLLGLENNLKAMADMWGQKAWPAALSIIHTLNNMIPAVQSAGMQILEWFGEVLPQVMRIASDSTHALSDAFNKAWPVLVGFLGEMMARLPSLERFWREFLSVAIDAIEGLMKGLLALSDWFITRLPTWGPIVGQIMGAIGKDVLGFLQAVGRLADYFVANWPKITLAASDAWAVWGPFLSGLIEGSGRAVDWFIQHWPEVKASITSVFLAIKEGWDLVQPVFKTMKDTLDDLAPTIKFFKDHANELRPILIGLGLALASIVLSLIILAGMIGAVALGLEVVMLTFGEVARRLVESWGPATKWAGERMSDLGTTVRGVTEAIGGAFDALGSTVNGVLGGIGGAFSGLGGTVRWILGEIDDNFSAMGSFVNGVLGSIGGAMSQLGSTANWVVGEIGGAFSWLGGTVSGVLGWIGGEMSNLGSTANWVVGEIGGAFSWLGGTMQGILGWIGDRMSDLGSTARWLGDTVWGAANDFVGAFGRAEDSVWSLIWALSRVAGAVWDALSNIPAIGGAISYLQALQSGHGRASGGPVLAGSIYTVGERGPETLVMGRAGGGYIIPNANEGGGGAGGPYNITINISGAQNPEATAAAVDWRLSRLLTSV